MRRVLAAILQTDPGLEVVAQAPNPLVARELVKQTNPDVLTLDVEMPGMDGLALLAALRDEDMNDDGTPVVRAEPDGHTLYLADTATMVVNPLLHAQLPYDPAADLATITALAMPSVVLRWSSAQPMSRR